MSILENLTAGKSQQLLVTRRRDILEISLSLSLSLRFSNYFILLALWRFLHFVFCFYWYFFFLPCISYYERAEKA